MKFDLVIPKTKLIASQIQVLRSKIRFDDVRRAGNMVMSELLRNVMLRENAYGSSIAVLGNMPDWFPFTYLLPSEMPFRVVEIETKRTGADNKRIETKSLIVHEKWMRNEPLLVIIDSCIAGGSTYAEAFLPTISALTDSVDKIVYCVLIAAQDGVEKVKSSTIGFADSLEIVSAAVDPELRNGWIYPGVGPDNWTKRIPEKMGVIPLWKEYPISAATSSLNIQLSKARGWEIALECILLWLIWFRNRNNKQAANPKWLAEHLLSLAKDAAVYDQVVPQELSAVGSWLRDFVSSHLDSLGWAGFISENYPYWISIEGEFYLNKVCINTLERHPTYGSLADSFYRISRRILRT